MIVYWKAKIKVKNSQAENLSYINSIIDAQTALLNAGKVINAIDVSQSFGLEFSSRVVELAYQIFGVKPASTVNVSSVATMLMQGSPIKLVTRTGTLSVSLKNGITVETQHKKIKDSFNELISGAKNGR